uniref:Shikimate kinase I n=1 Tax=uncultured organism TaxID=155900 RepID=G8DB32_9ZZZZ|nr:shikimate kinase I [uncultured organism]
MVKIMIRSRNIFLIGMSGVGKSTIGKQLANELKMVFYDSDEIIEKRCGAEISWILDIEGEEGFRKRESDIIYEFTEKKGIVLATGSGVVLKKSNCNRLSARGTVIYLRASLKLHVERSLRDKKKYLIQKQNQEIELRKIQEKRDPLYNRISDIIIDANSSSIRSIVNNILDKLNEK